MAPVGEEEPPDSVTNRKDKSGKNKEEKETKSEENEKKKNNKKSDKEEEKERDEDKDKDESQEREKAPTAFEKLCYKLNINPNLVMLKVTLFMMYGGKSLL